MTFDNGYDTGDVVRLFFGHAPEWSTAVNDAVVAVLQQAPGRPDVDRVKEFVDRTAHDVHDADVPDGVGI